MLIAADTLVRSLHLIGAAVWAGGMVMLALAVGAARRTVAEHERIVDALERRAGDELATLLQEHLHNMFQAIRHHGAELSVGDGNAPAAKSGQ